VKQLRQHGGNVAASCPAHDDRHASLSLRVKDGRLLWHCHSGCSQEAVLHALKMLGVTKHDLGAALHSGNCTLDKYAKAKRLRRRFLRNLGLRTIWCLGRRAVRIPYYDVEFKEVAIRFRLALERSDERDERFRWRKHDR